MNGKKAISIAVKNVAYSFDNGPILADSENSPQVLINASMVPAPVLLVCGAFCSLYICTPEAKHKSC